MSTVAPSYEEATPSAMKKWSYKVASLEGTI